MSQFYSLRWGRKTSHMVPGFVPRQLSSGAVCGELWDLSRAVEGMGKTPWQISLVPYNGGPHWLEELVDARNGGC